ncbi:hypothetical protein FRX31_012431 [Thalictrum thalictroides]|uniref:Reverse transcriptase zinc-binding domain-containing protein n=1 Tax=Thalictrum thalictroides TaxID=46969 RepID=A0A7J6WPC1_THATH|nr:hypothetical protein FRX31_012431 [Thalictrum thalictroides]
MYLEKDLVVWTPTSSGEFSTKSAYRAFNHILNKVVWHSLVWGKFVIPKYSFTFWQLFSGSIQTVDRLRQKGIPAANGCVLCGNQRESFLHLFFECRYSSKVWQGIKNI